MISRNIFFVVLMFFACDASQPMPAPTPIPEQTFIVHDTIRVLRHDTVKVVRYDTLQVLQHDTINHLAYVVRDTSDPVKRIMLHPVAGDNWQQIQNAINYAAQDGRTEVFLDYGTFTISRPLIWSWIVDGRYHQVTPRLTGASNAKNTPDGNVTRLIYTGTDGFAIGVQQGKGGYIRNLQITGGYTFPDRLNVIQIDTMRAGDWNDGIYRQAQYSPHAGIVIDPFCNPNSIDSAKGYPGLWANYLPTMGNSGSTAVTVEGVAIKNFVVGMIVSPGATLNGEIIHLYHSQIQSCKTAYALCQAQSKQCEVKDLECWGPVFTLFDNTSWGVRHGDGAGSPKVDGVNIASHIHQIFQISNYTFHGSFHNIYGEGVFKLGMLGGNAGAELNCEFDFENSNAGVPTPDYYFYATNTIFDNCILRLYSGAVPGMRITHNGTNNTFIGGEQTAPPLIRIYGGNPISYPRITGMVQYWTNGVIDDSHYDTSYWNTATTTLHVNPDFSGWFTKGDPVGQRGDFSKIKVGDIFVNNGPARDIWGTIMNYPIGYCSAIRGDTVFLTNVGVGLRDGQIITAIQYGLK